LCVRPEPALKEVPVPMVRFPPIVIATVAALVDAVPAKVKLPIMFDTPVIVLVPLPLKIRFPYPLDTLITVWFPAPLYSVVPELAVKVPELEIGAPTNVKPSVLEPNEKVLKELMVNVPAKSVLTSKLTFVEATVTLLKVVKEVPPIV
jgi:hypothetical protein